jgi:hypothetical protein
MNNKSMRWMMRAMTKRVVIVMRVAGNTRVRVARAMVLVMRVACKEDSNGNGGKSDGNKGGEQAMATRAMAMATAMPRAMTMVTRLVGDKGQGWQGQWQWR